MSYERKVAVLGATLAALLAMWGAGALFSPERRTVRAEARALLSAPISEAATIEIGLPKIALSKKGDSWYLLEGAAALPARDARIKSFLDAVAAAKRLKPVGRTKEAWKGLGLTEDKARPVLIRDAKGRTTADFLLGGNDPAGSSVFLRLAGSDASYAVDGAIASYVSSDRRSWLDLRVVPGPIPEGDVEGLSIKASLALDGAGKPPLALDYSLRREKDGWSGVAGSIDPVAVASLIRSIVNIEGEDIVAAPPKDAFASISARIELSLGNGASRALEVGSQAGEGRFYLRLAGGSQVYAVSAYGLRNALKRPSDILSKK